jgi:hypothetical protein
MSQSPFRLIVLLAPILATMFACPHLSSATTFTVTDFGDTVPGGAIGQLRRLINDASPGDTIVIPAGIITLTGASNENANASGDLDIVKNLTIQGAGAGVTIIDGGGIDRVIDVVSSTVIISGLTIRNGNRGSGDSGGGVRNQGTLTLTDVAVSGNSAGNGGGMINNGTLTAANITVNGNTAAGASGGGIVNGGTMTLINCTISGNAAVNEGGGLLNFAGTSNLTNVTITNNTADSDNMGGGVAGGIEIFAGTTVNVKNTIVAGNKQRTTGSVPDDCFGTLTSQGFNLIQTVASCTVAGTTTGNLTGVNPNLGPLANNGGTTQTHALLSGSPAINAGTNVGCPATDQRGIARPQGGTCDIGAYEAVIAFDPAPATAFVTRLYQTVLLREPDAAGLAAHLQNIQSFETVIPTVLAFFKSQEFLSQALSDPQFLDRLYHTFLNRAPDPAGLAAFLDLLQTGCRTRDTLLADLTFSPEFRALLPPITAADLRVPFVAELYAWILNRPADLPGLQSFVNQLQRSTVLSTVLSFLHSAEFTTPRRSATDYVSALYLVALGRAPDCPGLAGFVAALNPDTDAARDQLLAQFAASAEFQTKLDQLFP